ncbi:MAG: L-2-amino-thiazoline-4-carboxylic acid hydrolase [Solobacterium sp.]|nr:L-2-amino-thiazoline-4-carboxylic acid hydrolase [Solobacterium sp.]
MSFEQITKGLYPQKYNVKIQNWLRERYGKETAEDIWNRTKQSYVEYMKDLPDYGGKKGGHAAAIYGGLLIFSLYPLLPDQPPISELQDFVQTLFMGPFTALGKVFDLNRSADMRLIDAVFQATGRKDRKSILKYPAGFMNINEPYDKENRISRYRFTQCPNAAFAAKHGLNHVLPLLCNSDYFGIREIHGQLIRCSTCGNGSQCDYCVVGSRHPLAQQYETVTDEGGFLVSRRKEQ